MLARRTETYVETTRTESMRQIADSEDFRQRKKGLTRWSFPSSSRRSAIAEVDVQQHSTGADEEGRQMRELAQVRRDVQVAVEVELRLVVRTAPAEAQVQRGHLRHDVGKVHLHDRGHARLGRLGILVQEELHPLDVRFGHGVNLQAAFEGLHEVASDHASGHRSAAHVADAIGQPRSKRGLIGDVLGDLGLVPIVSGHPAILSEQRNNGVLHLLLLAVDASILKNGTRNSTILSEFVNGRNDKNPIN